MADGIRLLSTLGGERLGKMNFQTSKFPSPKRRMKNTHSFQHLKSNHKHFEGKFFDAFYHLPDVELG